MIRYLIGFCFVCVACSSSPSFEKDPGDAQSESSMPDASGDESAVMEASVDDGGASDGDAASVLDAAGDGSDGSVKNYRRVFISSSVQNGYLGGLAGADMICVAAATSASLGGKWKAWLSSSTVSASSRLEHAVVPYQLLDGTQVAADWTALISGTIDHVINLDENKTVVPFQAGKAPYTGLAWTGTNTDGSSYTLDTCNDWMSSSPSSDGSFGADKYTTSYWTFYSGGASFCEDTMSLYCIEQGS